MTRSEIDDSPLAARKAIEALRAGVPSLDAIELLGSAQSDVEARFDDLCGRLAQGGASPPGLLLGGGFGSGKSHLLGHLAQVATRRGLMVSRVVISKETPLYDPVKVLRAAIASARIPGSVGDAVNALAAAVDVESKEWAELHRAVHSPGIGLDERFGATVSLYGRRRVGDDEFAQAVVRFWAGDPIRVPDLRRRLKEVGEAAAYSLGPVKERDLSTQRLAFLARLARAAGLVGWVILLDEVELIGRYSALQRGKAYAELSRWLGPRAVDPGAPLGAVVAMTDDFESAVLTDKGDRACIPPKLRGRADPAAEETAAAAEAGMRAIARDVVLLRPPDAGELDRAHDRLRALHGTAFGWDPPVAAGISRTSSTRMRQYVRAWINEWDLVRLDPTYRPVTEVAEVVPVWDEDPDLERE
ncbi:MAG: hypothetical protein NVS3B12_31170 [Acidimicrobiales bacterium]